MFRLTKKIMMPKTFKNKMKQQIANVLTQNVGPAVRSAPEVKQRKYKNIEITQDFKKLDQKRKKQRYQNMKKRQQLLQQKLKNQQLLTAPQTETIKSQLTQLQDTLATTQQQLTQLQTIIENSQPQHMVVEGVMKLAVINHIKYIQYLHSNNPGYNLHPETIKAIENVHYCVNHNLPVNRISLYEIMPEYFQAQIGELEDSVQRLITEKKIFIEDQESKSSIRFFHRAQTIPSQFNNASFLQVQKEQTFQNMADYCHQLFSPHIDYLQKVQQGKTPFRNLSHMTQVMLSDMPIKYLPQQQGVRKVILQLVQIQKQWVKYKQAMDKQIHQFTYRYMEPPSYIKNHPMLSKAYEKVMEKWNNPIPIQTSKYLESGDTRQVQLGKKMQDQIRSIVKQKYDPLFIEAMNNDRSKIDKKKLQIQFYNLSTNVLENLRALENKSSQDQQFFEKVQKQKSYLLGQRKKNLLKMDQLTRILFLNNKDKNKYNLEFFSNWFGIDKNQLGNVLKYVSYLQVFQNQNKDKNKEQDIKFQILKFQV